MELKCGAEESIVIPTHTHTYTRAQSTIQGVFGVGRKCLNVCRVLVVV